VTRAIPSSTDAARMRAAIARDQTSHWRRLFWEPARTKKELDRRERMWFWWGSIGWQAEMASRGISTHLEQSWARGR
jgi:hypothetical protein